MKLLGYKSIKDRNKAIAEAMVNKRLTIREIASNFGLSKSTVHEALSNYINANNDSNLSSKVMEQIKNNLANRTNH